MPEPVLSQAWETCEMAGTFCGIRSRLCLFGLLLAVSLSTLCLCGCAGGPSLRLTPEEAAACAPDAPPKAIRILTINVWSGLTYEGTFAVGHYPDEPEIRYKRLLEGVRQLGPDVITIQEANPLPGYAERLARDLDYRMICHVALGGIRFGPVGVPTNLREGDAILVKKPATLVDLGVGRLAGCGIVSNWFTFHTGEITQAILARAVLNGKPIYIYAVHLHSGPFPGPQLRASAEQLSNQLPEPELGKALKAVNEDVDRRGREMAALKAFIGKTLPADAVAVIAGDFNTTAESGELAPLLASGRWTDSFSLKNPDSRGFTWDPPRNPNFRPSKPSSRPYNILKSLHENSPARIDFILLNDRFPPGTIRESRVVLTPLDGVTASDHYGVLTTIQW